MQLRSIFIYLSLGFFVPLSSSSDAGFLKQGDFFVPSLSASLSGMTGDFSRLQWHCNDSDDDDDYSGSLLSTCSSFSQLLVKLLKHSFWIVPLFTKSSLIHQNCYKIIWGRAHQNQFVGWWLEERRRRRGVWLSAPLIGTRWVIVSIKGWWFLILLCLLTGGDLTRVDRKNGGHDRGRAGGGGGGKDLHCGRPFQASCEERWLERCCSFKSWSNKQEQSKLYSFRPLKGVAMQNDHLTSLLGHLCKSLLRPPSWSVRALGGAFHHLHVHNYLAHSYKN